MKNPTFLQKIAIFRKKPSSSQDAQDEWSKYIEFISKKIKFFATFYEIQQHGEETIRHKWS